ncbi:hypothetical protein [Marinobacter sp. C2H3]|uniref:hypothetical protein n=1 Tax=Marinobacter sp. C2H3 TaxID=3119003 RepID=UPI00300F2443
MTVAVDLRGYTRSAYHGMGNDEVANGDCKHSFMFRNSWTMGRPLVKDGRYSGLFPPLFLDKWRPDTLRSSKRPLDMVLERRALWHDRFDEECLKWASPPGSSKIILRLHYWSRFIFLMFFPIFCLAVVIQWLLAPDDPSFGEFLNGDVSLIFMAMFVPMLLCWSAGWFLETYFPRTVRQPIKGPKWELNRRTGLVTLYHKPGSNRTGEIRAQAPFREWDAYLLSLPGPQGNFWYQLVLVHQVHEWALPMSQMFAPTTNREQVLALWDVIRQYMNVTQPLPDMPVLEPYRKLDPTTLKYDNETGRDPNYWRNMDDDAYKAFCDRNYRQLCRYNWENECDQMQAADAG